MCMGNPALPPARDLGQEATAEQAEFAPQTFLAAAQDPAWQGLQRRFAEGTLAAIPPEDKKGRV